MGFRPSPLRFGLPQPSEQLNIVHDFDGVLPAVGDDGFVEEVPIPRAENVGPGNDGRCNNMVVIWVMWYHPNNIPLTHFHDCGIRLKDRDSTLNFLVVKSMHLLQPGIAKDPA
jgi:hypothetical protein